MTCPTENEGPGPEGAAEEERGGKGGLELSEPVRCGGGGPTSDRAILAMPCRGGGIPPSEDMLLGDNARDGGLFGALIAPLLPRSGRVEAGVLGKLPMGGNCGTGGGGG